jgi:mono/diheme cytochrome c family protein
VSPIIRLLPQTILSNARFHFGGYLLSSRDMRPTISMIRMLCSAWVLIGITEAMGQPLYPAPPPPLPPGAGPSIVAPLAIPGAPPPRPVPPPQHLGGSRPIAPRPVMTAPPGNPQIIVPSAHPLGMPSPPPLAFDAELKEYTVQPGESRAEFAFNITNTSAGNVVITSVRTSCGCTVAKLPPMPWTLGAGEHGEIQVAMDVAGKRGTLTKSVTVSTATGNKSVLVRATIPNPILAQAGNLDMDRQRNIQLALVDRQIVFKNDGAECHVTPALGKMGRPLYDAACGICHDSPHRATMVPDLAALPQAIGYDYWKHWITFGKPGSLMPAFAQAHGGPLTPEQIDSLSQYLAQTIQPRPAGAPAPASAPPAAYSNPNAAGAILNSPPLEGR